MIDLEWMSSLTAIELPVLNSSRRMLLALQDDPKVSASRIASVVLSDPMMTLKLMRLANAGRRGEFTQRIATVEHAVMLLGFSTVFARLAEMPVLEGAVSEHVRQGMLRLMSRACHASSQAREWAVQRLDIAPQEVYVAALLHAIAEMVLWVVEPEKMTQLAKEQYKVPWLDAEQARFGFPLIELSRALAEQWNMPPLVISAMQWDVIEGQARSNCVILANRLARNAETGWWGPRVRADIEEIAEIRRQQTDELIAQIHRTAVEAARRYAFLDITPAAAWLPMLEGEWPDEDAMAISMEPDVFQSVLNEIRSAAENSPALNELLALIIRGMRDGIGLHRIVFALLTQDRSELKPKYIYGAAEDSPLKAFHFDMRQKHLFSALVSKRQAIWLSNENRAKYAPVLSAEIDRITSGRAFYAMSLSVHGKIIGILYGDRTDGSLDAVGYEKFKMLSILAAESMTKTANPQLAHS